MAVKPSYTKRLISFLTQIKNVTSFFIGDEKYRFYTRLRTTLFYIKFTLKDIFLCRLFGARLSKEKFFSYQVSFLNYTLFRTLFIEIFILSQYYFKSKKNDPCIIDCGANFGISLIYFKFLYPGSRIFAFEPNQETYKILSENMVKNNLSDISLYNLGLSDQEGEAEFYTDKNNPGLNTLVKNVIEPSNLLIKRVKTGKLSKFINRGVDMLKIDTEGAEDKILLELEGENKLGLIENFAIEYHPSICQKFNHLSLLEDFFRRNQFLYQYQKYDSNYLFYAKK